MVALGSQIVFVT